MAFFYFLRVFKGEDVAGFQGENISLYILFIFWWPQNTNSLKREVQYKKVLMRTVWYNALKGGCVWSLQCLGVGSPNTWQTFSFSINPLCFMPRSFQNLLNPLFSSHRITSFMASSVLRNPNYSKRLLSFSPPILSSPTSPLESVCGGETISNIGKWWRSMATFTRT